MPTEDMGFGGESIEFTEEFTNSSAIELLRKLAKEDGEEGSVRRNFKDNPRGELAKVGIIVSERLLPDGPIVLPPVHQIRELLYYLAQEDEFGPAGCDPPLGFIVYILVWAFKPFKWGH
jgi:hypothetical protein